VTLQKFSGIGMWAVCHSERSEESGSAAILLRYQILRCAQNDTYYFSEKHKTTSLTKYLLHYLSQFSSILSQSSASSREIETIPPTAPARVVR
jgi:hypothetical protein